jgi:hypothetical protein
MSIPIPNPLSQQAPTVLYIHDGKEINLQVLQDPQSGKNMVSCDLCNTSVTLAAKGSLRYFEAHRGSFKCIQAQNSLMHQRNHQEIQEVLLAGKVQSSRPSSKPFI